MIATYEIESVLGYSIRVAIFSSSNTWSESFCSFMASVASWPFPEVQVMFEATIPAFLKIRLAASTNIMLAEELIHSGRDPQKVSRFLEWQEFEDFVKRWPFKCSEP